MIRPSVLALVLVVLGGCNRDEALTIYSGRDRRFLEPLIERFEKETGHDVAEPLYDKSSMLLQRLQREGEATGCDVYVTNDSATLERARLDGLLAPLADDLLARVDPRFRAKDGAWIGISARVRVLVYNTNRVPAAEIPTSVFDLADPRWMGKVGITSRTNESFVSGIASMIADHGEERTREFLRKLEGNVARYFEKHTPIVEAIAKGDGEIVLGWVNHYYYYRHKAEHPSSPIGIVFPDQDGKGAAWNVAGAGIAKSAPRPEVARRFLEYLLSSEGQEVFARENFEYPVLAGPATHPDVPPRASIRLSEVGIEEMGLYQRMALRMATEAGLD